MEESEGDSGRGIDPHTTMGAECSKGDGDVSRSLASSVPASVDVVIPTYNRPEFLDRCLGALAVQTRPADRVLVVARGHDVPSHVVVERFVGRLPGVELVRVDEPGRQQVVAMRAGVASSTGDVIAFTDDDAAPRPEWLARLLYHFADPTVGAVGGRDVIPGHEQPLSLEVGRYRRSGRLTGMHHLGMGPPRDVDVLKGVNMAFRVDALALPAKGVLRGAGAVVGEEDVACAWSRQRNWRVVYDSAVQVDHEGAARPGGERERPPLSAVFDAAFNTVVAASMIGSPTMLRHVGYGIAVGTSDLPGVMRAAAALLRREREVLLRAGPALAGRLTALVWLLARTFARGRPLVITARELRDAELARSRAGA